MLLAIILLRIYRKHIKLEPHRIFERCYLAAKSFKDSNNRYEIKLLSGRYVYTDSVIVTKDTITFENKKSLVVSVNRDEIFSLKKLK
ncbi:MAG: hypothetical protein ACI8ZB_005419 [Desulforhopalus sp.]|jgi:hypothetical protein